MEASGPTSSVDWAQPLARPQELVAVGAGATVHVFGLKGDACRGTMQYELLADLSHAAPVWRVQWDQMGNQLAVSTDDQCVHVYRPDMVGNWRKLVCLAGSAEVEGGPTDLECD